MFYKPENSDTKDMSESKLLEPAKEKYCLELSVYCAFIKYVIIIFKL